MPQSKYKLLLVEDSDDDAMLFSLALRRSSLNESFELLQRLLTAEAAIDYFSQPPSVVDGQPRPDILILDLKLPGRSGFDVLKALRKLNMRPVVGLFTTSIMQTDKQQAEALGADLFQTKNFESTEFTRFLHWLARLVDNRRCETV
jgi:CheY-like chemotaxis protein